MDRQKFLVILLSVVLISISGRSFASHFVGGNITYRCIDSTLRRFEISLTIYRDCAGIAAPANASVVYSSVNCGFSASVTLNPIAGTGQEISPRCSTTVTRCAGGTFPGIQEWVYRRVVTLPMHCTDWKFSYTANARNAAITTIVSPGTQNIHIEAALDNLTKKYNNSPTFSNKPVAFACINQSFTYNHGAIDADGDSLVYSLVTPKTGNATTVAYLPGFSATSPLSSSPPVSFNNQTGDIVMRPTAIQQTVMAVLVREYRNGIFIGSILRDIQIVVINCNSNSLPQSSYINMTGQSDTTTCAGTQICFNITSSDSNAGDTVSMSWNSGIPAGTFTVAGNYRPTGTFCWTPTPADVNSNPYFFTVTVRDNACPIIGAQTRSYSVRVVPQLTVNLGADQPLNCNLGNTIIATPGGHLSGLQYTWSTGSTASTIVVNNPGTYWVNVTNSLGCTASDTIRIIRDVTANFNFSAFCQGLAANFTDASSSTPGIASWSWNFGDATTSTLANPSHAYAAAGNYNVKLVVTDGLGCKDSITRVVTVNAKPVAGFTIPAICLPAASNFTNTSTIASGSITSWTWTFGDATGSALQNPTHAYAAPGTYSVKLVVRSALGCLDSISINAVVNAKPVASFSADTACSLSPTKFIDLSTISSGVITGWAWDFGDGSGSTSQNTSNAYASGGSYTTSLIVSSIAGCTDTISQTVVVRQSPVADFTPGSGCTDVQTNFMDLSTITSGSIVAWRWDLGNGVTSVSKDTSFTYTTAGNYNVKHVAISNLGCADSIIKVVPVFETPVAKFTNPHACEGVALNFIDSSTIGSGSIASWNWTFGDGNTSNMQHPTHTYAAPGTYTVRLTIVSGSGCSNMLVSSITVHPRPVVDFGPVDVCFPSPTAYQDQTTISTGTLSAWSWDFGNSDTSTQQNPVYTYSTGGIYSVKLIVTSTLGCTDSAIKTVTVHEIPVPDFAFDTVCNTFRTTFKDLSTIPSDRVNSWSWDFGDGTGSTLQDPLHTYASGGTFNVKLIAYSDYQCSDSIIKAVRVNSKPIVKFKANNACLTLPTNFIDSTTATGTTISSWSWSFGDGTFANTQNPAHTYAAPGTYQVRLVVTTAEGCTDSLVQAVVVHPKPLVDFSPLLACFPTPTTFTDLAIISSGSLTGWSWKFGDGNTSTTQNPVHSYATGGNFIVQLNVTSALGCQDSAIKVVPVYPIPVPKFSANTVCEDAPTTFVDSSTIPLGSVAGWEWFFGDGSVSNSQHPTHTYTNPGTYTVKLIAYSALGCKDSISKTVTVNPKPVPDFTPIGVCSFVPTAFADISTIASGSISTWSWNFGDGDTSTTQNPMHTYSSVGNFNVKLVVGSAIGCKDSLTRSVSSGPLPVPDIGAVFGCNNNTTQFTDSSTIGAGSTITSRFWSFGDGDTSTAQNPSHTYLTNGSYTVKLIVTSSLGCQDSTTITAVINAKPIAHFGVNAPCIGLASNFIDSSTIAAGSIATWAWTFGDGNTSSAQNPNHTYAAPGAFTTKLVITSALGCMDSMSRTVLVHPRPVPDFSPYVACFPTPTVFTDLSAIASGVVTQWVWDFGDGDTSTLESPVHVYATGGNYNVKMVVTSGYGCKDSLTTVVPVYPIPVPRFSATSVCRDLPTAFTDSSTIPLGSITGWDWNFGDGNTSTAQHPTHTYAAAGTYSVKLILTSALGCQDSLTKNIVVHPRPVPAFGAPAACLGFNNNFTDSSTIPTGTITGWTWSFGDASTSTLQNPAHTYGSFGTFQAKLVTTSNFGCQDSVTNNIIVHPRPVVDFTPYVACFPTPTTFSDITTIATGTLASRLWDFGDSTTSTAINPVHSYTNGNGGSYPVKLIVTSTLGCIDSLETQVPVHPVPVVKFSATTVCNNLATVFTDSSSMPVGTIASYSWNFGDGNSDTARHPNHTYAAAGTYSVKLIVTSVLGCIDSLSKNVTIYPRPVPAFGATTACFPHPSDFTDSSTLSTGSISSWSWTFGDATTSGTQDPTHAYTAAGSYSAKLVVTSDLGCADSIIKTVTVNDKPTPGFIAYDTCFAFANRFNDTSSIANGSIVGWTWAFGDASTSAAQNPTHTYPASGPFTVKLVVFSALGCKDSTSKTVTVNPKPAAGFTFTTSCFGDTTFFPNTASVSSGILVAWDWDFGDGQISSDPDRRHLYDSAGTFQVKLIVTSDAGCMDSIVQPVTVNPKPIAAFSAPAACFPFATTFTDSATITSGSIVSTAWDFGDSDTSTTQNPVHTYAAAGNYSATQIVTTDLGCKDTLTQTVVVNHKPAPNFSAPANCFPLQKQFTDSSVIGGGSINAWSWDFGDGDTSTQQNPSHTYATDGIQTIKLRVTSAAGCTDSITKTSIVHPAPSTGFVHLDICAPLPVAITNTSFISSGTIDSYAWDFGDGTTSSVTSPSHSYASHGTYNIKLKATSNFGCTDSIITSTLANARPTANFTTANGCFSDSTVFNDSSAVDTGSLVYWFWNFGDSTSSLNQHPAHLYAAPGTYSVSMYVLSSGDCNDTITKTVVVYPKPAPAFGATTSCYPAATAFTDSSSVSSGAIASWSWDFGDGDTSTAQNPSHAYTTAGTYTVVLRVTTALGCTDSTSRTVVVNPRPVPAFGATTPCFPFNTNFTDSSTISTGSIATWSWNFGDAGISATQSPSHTYSTAGTYTAKLVITSALGCSDSLSKSVTVNPRPVTGFSVNNSCFSFANNFTDTSTVSTGSINSWSWTFGDAAISAAQNPAHTYAAAGSYTTQLVVTSALGCKDSTTKIVTVHPAPVAGFNSTTVCHPDTTEFTNTSTVSTGSITANNWHFGDATTASTVHADHKYANPGAYSIKLVVTTDQGCKDSITQNENVNARPVAGFSVPAACFPFNSNFTDTTTISAGALATWNWNFGDGNTSTTQNPAHAYAAAGSYTARLSVTSGLGCTDTTSRMVVVNPKPAPAFTTNTVCNGFATQFTNSSTVSTGSITTYSWNFGDGNTSASSDPAHTYAAAGTYNVKLVITTANGCTDSVTNTVTVHPRPVPLFNVVNACYTLSNSFTDQSTVSTGTITGWLWNFGDSSTSTATNPAHGYATSGTYSIKLIVTTALGCSDSISRNMTLFPLPVPAFNVTAACSSFANVFSDSSTIPSGSNTSWSWDFGDAATSAISNPSHIYAAAGSYTAKLRVTSALGCVDSISKSVTVNPNPVAGFNSTTVCHPDTTVFTNTSNISAGSITANSWNFGDATTASTQHANHKYANPGTYSIKLVVTSALGCRDSITQSENSNARPVAGFSAPAACFPFANIFSDTTTISAGALVTWNWNFGDGNTSNSQNPAHGYASAGSYTARLSVTSGLGCTDTTSRTIIVNPKPAPGFTANTVCNGFATQFTNSSTVATGSIATYSWNFGDGNTSSATDPAHTYAAAGSYNVKLIITTANGCTDSVTNSVTIHPKPAAIFNVANACYALSNTFTDQSTVSTGTITGWLWNFGDSTTSTATNPAHSYAASGSYSIKLTVTTALGCSDSISRNLTLFPLPLPAFNVTAACSSFANAFTDSSTIPSGNNVSWSWDFGDAVTAAIPNPSHIYAATGSYTAKLRVTSALGCVDSISKTVTVNPNPVAGFNSTTVCHPDNTVFTNTSTLSSGSIASYSWNFGDASTASSQHATHKYANPGTYSIKMVVTSALGCKDSIAQNENSNARPVAGFLVPASCFPFANNFTDTTTISSGAVATWNWNFGDGNTSTSQNPAHAYASAGTYTATLTVGSGLGCTDTTSRMLVVDPKPTPGFKSTTVCQGLTTEFADTSTVSSGAIISWNWDFGDTTYSSAQNPGHVYRYSGNFQTKLVVETASGCTDSIVAAVVINARPVPDFNPITACYAYPNSFTDISTVASGTINSWLWNFGDSATSTLPNTTHKYATHGTYPVQLTVSTALGCTDSITRNVTLFPLPVPSFNATAACSSFANSFTDVSSIPSGSITSWNWNFGDATTSASVNPTHTYAAAGTYTTKLILTSALGCTDSVSNTVTVHPNPVAGFNASTACFPFATSFSDSSTITGGTINSWNWNLGDSSTTTSQNPVHSYASAGSRMIKLTAMSTMGCKDSITKAVVVNPKPAPDFAATTACHTFASNFTDSSSVSTGAVNAWTWNFGDGNSSAAQNPSHVYAAPGTYNVQLRTGSALGCRDSIVKTVTVNPNPVSNFVATNACFGFASIFTDSSSILSGSMNSWSWNFGDASTSTSQHPSRIFGAAGTYMVKMIVHSASGCSDSITLPVVVNPKPLADFSAPPVCDNSPTSFSDQSGVASGSLTGWSWRFGDAYFSTQQNPVHLYDTAGAYSATLVVNSNFGCIDSLTKAITIQPNPVAKIGATAACHNSPTQFTDSSSVKTGTITSWSWEFGDGFTSASQNPSHTYANSGSYTVKLKVFSALGCIDSTTKTVTVHPNPTADFYPTPICQGIASSFNDASWITSGNVTGWKWNFGDGDSANSMNPKHTYSAAGTYQARLIATSAMGCRDTIFKPIVVNSKPVVRFGTSQICHGNNTTFTDSSVIASGTINTWKWVFGDGGSIFQQNPSHNYALAGNYQVTLTATSATGCSDSLTKTIAVNPGPAANFFASGLCDQSPTRFGDSTKIQSGTINSWSWNFGDGAVSTQQHPSHTYPGTGTYRVTLFVVSTLGCNDSVSKDVTIFGLPNAAFNTQNGCSGKSLNLTDSSYSLSSTINGWSWNFGDGGISSSRNPAHVFGEGVFNVKLIVTDNHLCRDSIVKPVIIFEKPVAQFAVLNNCINEAQTLVDQTVMLNGNIVSQAWDFGDGSTDSGANIQHKYLNAGNYNVTLIISSDNGCLDTLTRTISIFPKPVADFTATNLCINDSARFNDISAPGSGSIVQWSWNFGDGGTATIKSPAHKYQTGGAYNVELIVTSSAGCRDTISKFIQIYPLPVVDFIADPPVVCQNLPVTFTDFSTSQGSDIVKWFWDFGDFTSSTEQNPTHIYNKTGKFTVRLTVTNDQGCTATMVADSLITSVAMPDANFSANRFVANFGDPSFIFTNTSVGSIHHGWEFGDGNDASDAVDPVTHTYEDTGTYNVMLWAVNTDGCTDTIVKPVKVTPHFTFFIPGAFSPDENGLNDVFGGIGLKYGVIEQHMEIYNRWGQRIFETDQLGEGWNGKYFNVGEPVQMEVYVYLIRVKDWTGKTHFFKGEVHLIR
jgi:gliding motility-associated-like protein